jgi:hypothetical protein
MHFISTSKTSGLVIGNGKKLSARMKSGNEPTKSSMLLKKEPNERGRRQKLRGQGEWKRRNVPPERKQSARG